MDYKLLKTFGLGVGSALVAIAVFPIIAKAAEPLVKRVIKEGMDMKDKMQGDGAADIK